MPSLLTARRTSKMLTNNARSIGQIHKENADFLMNETWFNDIQAKICYIYDYFHDDFFTDEFGNITSLKEGMTYENTHKTRIDVKFMIKSYQSMDKDEVEHYVQFRPNQKRRFSEEDELYYYEKDYHKRFSAGFPIGLYLDIPDSDGVYHKWLICRKESANQFPKYLVLPVDYELMWVEQKGSSRIKRRMWAVLRNQQSYTAGVYRDRYFAHADNQNKVWLPMNSITEKFWYTGDDEKDTRLIVSALTERPIVWKVTKVENTAPLGLQKLTIYSDFFNEHTDYVNLETGEMYADYFDTSVEPTEEDAKNPILYGVVAQITAANSTIKIGGSYKTLTVKVINGDGEDITSFYSDATYKWSCGVANVDLTEWVTWRECADKTQIKIKFANDISYMGEILNVTCNVVVEDEIIANGSLQLEVS